MRRELLLARRQLRTANRLVQAQLEAARIARGRGEAGALGPGFLMNWQWRRRVLRGYLAIKAPRRARRAS